MNQRVLLQTAPERFERQQIGRWNVAQIRVGAEPLDEPHLLLALERLEHEHLRISGGQDGLDELDPNLLPDRANFATFDDYFLSASRKLLGDHLFPVVILSDDLAADFGEHFDV